MKTGISANLGRSLRAALFLGCVTVIAPSAVFAEDAGKGANEPVVRIDNFAFSPAELKVKAGTKVTFVNHDDIPHSIVAGDGQFHSKALDTDDSFVFTFTTAGETGYFCGLHPHMLGKIVVVP